MALTNKEKVGRGFDQLLEGLAPFVDARMSAIDTGGRDWAEVLAAADSHRTGSNQVYSKTDVRFLLKVVTERWQVFKDELSRPESALATELRDIGNKWAHGDPFSSDDTYRALDTIERFCQAIGAADQAAAVAEMRVEHQRSTFEQQARNRVSRAATTVTVTGAVAGTAIKPWREVVTPHPDVTRGQFSAAEFAADLYAVAGGLSAAREYSDPKEFFERTYLTSGLQDLLTRAVRRFLGDAGASPVVNLQTQFGGGKTHSMLALFHLFSGVATDQLPQGLQDLVAAARTEVASLADSADGRVAERIETQDDLLATMKVRRVTLVGTRLSPNQPRIKPDGTEVATLWGELVWQLGGRDAYDRVARADQAGVDPGDALDELVRDITADGTKILVLIDEWVAYARQIVNSDNLSGGSFEAQHTFAQHLTELAKTTPGMMLVVSIPASDSLDNGGGGSALEVGGPNGRIALEMLSHVIGRNADDWRPANNTESFEIVRRRLFVEPDAAALADIAAIAKSYVKFYQENSSNFPRETVGGEYEARIKAAYPIHPEFFDRLYEDWSALPKFQRTRGVLRLMSVIINALWNSGDASPLITPGTVPIHDTRVFSEITKYLDDNWKPVVDKDVDGEGSTPVTIDHERPSFGSRALTRRVARTVFIATVPTLRAAHRGVDLQHLRLGVAIPGDNMSHIGDARELLGQRATYLYEDGDRTWYDVAASVSRVAAERAEGYSEADIHGVIVERLQAEVRRGRGAFAYVHAGIQDTGDVPDTDSLRLVLVHPREQWAKDASSATEFAEKLFNTVGSGQRQRKNMVVIVAADRSRYPDLDAAVREWRAWSSIVAEAAVETTTERAGELGISGPQIAQAKTRVKQAEQVVAARLRATYSAVLTLSGGAGEKPKVAFDRVGDSDAPLAERVTEKLKSVGKLSVELRAALLRIALDGSLASVWSRGHVSVADLWDWFTQYPYLKRLKSRDVLTDAVASAADVLLWQQDAFALAVGRDEETGRYLGLWTRDDGTAPPPIDNGTLLVTPAAAVAQRAAELEDRTNRTSSGANVSTVSTDPLHEPGTTPGKTDPGDEPHSSPQHTGHAGPGNVSVPQARARPRRYFGTKVLRADIPAADFAKINEEILQRMTAEPDARLEVRIEITATSEAGFDEALVRTVGENANALKFEQSGFEER
ncbi:Predicted ATPase, AAA+ superfamily [Micrococcales bacterium KH10]|nr:Predicted ATPase, AAA+ superfamily [Micrococcales bacterium KH10]